MAEALAGETIAAEAELLSRPLLVKKLGLGKTLESALKISSDGKRVSSPVRLIRFDFHFTTTGWRISEANSDVPGGFVEASGFTRLMHEHHASFAFRDPAHELAKALRANLLEGAVVAMVHATAFSDDRQVMSYLGKFFEQRGLRPVVTAPDFIQWRDGRAWLQTDWFTGAIDFIFRFYPGEWLPNLPGKDWKNFFIGSDVRMCNPPSALLTQSKRFPLVWNDLATPLPTWRKLLPETRDPREVAWSPGGEWVLKPALGRVGEMIGLGNVTTDKEWKLINKAVRRSPDYWVAQKRFDAVPVFVDGKNYYPCIGVYTINDHVAGAYGRINTTPLIDYRAQDIAILTERDL